MAPRERFPLIKTLPAVSNFPSPFCITDVFEERILLQELQFRLFLIFLSTLKNLYIFIDRSVLFHSRVISAILSFIHFFVQIVFIYLIHNLMHNQINVID